MLGTPPVRHWVLVVSLDSRNMSERVDSVLIVPFGSQGADGPTTVRFESGQTGLPGPSWLKGHFITTLQKSLLAERLPRTRHRGNLLPHHTSNYKFLLRICPRRQIDLCLSLGEACGAYLETPV